MNKAILSVAGGRKTQSIVDHCATQEAKRRRIILTFTLTGQRELERRVSSFCAPDRRPVIMGWYAFLIRHLIRPYLPLLYPSQEITGLHFDDEEPRKKLRASGASRYFDSSGRAYKMRLAKLAFDVAVASKGAVLDRLEHIYEDVMVDEVQDLTGSSQRRVWVG